MTDITEEMMSAGYDATRLEDGTPQFADAGFTMGHADKIYRAMQKVARDSKTGQFTTQEDAAARPGETTVETVKREDYHITTPSPLDLDGPGDDGSFIAYNDHYCTEEFSIIWRLRSDWACAVLGVNMGELEGIADQIPECASWAATSADEGGCRRLDSVDVIAIARARIAAIGA